MKKLFKPVVKLVALLGGLLRTIWNGKKCIIKTEERETAQRLNLKKNTITGGTVLTLLLSAFGIYSAVTPSDLDRLQTAMKNSFDRVEQLDYLALNADSVAMTAEELEIYYMRGKCKLLLSLINESNKALSEFNEIDYDENDSTIQLVIKTYNSYFAMLYHTRGVISELLCFKNSRNTKPLINALTDLTMTSIMGDTLKSNFVNDHRYHHAVADSVFDARIEVAAYKNNKAAEKYIEYLKKSDFGRETYNRSSKKDKIKMTEKILKSDELIGYNLATYHFIDVFYEYLIALQLNCKYDNKD